jgi:hypothetical protein
MLTRAAHFTNGSPTTNHTGKLDFARCIPDLVPAHLPPAHPPAGKLEHSELADFARCIPDLVPAEQKFIIVFMNQVRPRV